MSESPSSSSLATDQLGDSPAVDLIGKIMVIIIIVLFMVVVSALAVYLYAKVFRWRRTSQRQSQSQSQSRSQVTALDPSVLKSLPVSVFQPHDSSKENGVECSVCLSEFVEGEKLRVLPKCNHGFHVDCIDTWFQSHATCPLCRTLVVVVASQSQPQPGDLESQSFPTNVLIWGNQTQITSSGSTTAASLEESTSNNTTSTTSTRDRMLVIDIPSGHGEEEENSYSSSSSSSSYATATSSRFAEDDLKSPVLRSLRSLRRLLSNNRLNPWTPTSSTQTTTKGEEGHS